MSNHKSRLEKLETQLKRSGRMTWKEFINLDGQAFQDVLKQDPIFRAAWEAMTTAPQDPQGGAQDAKP